MSVPGRVIMAGGDHDSISPPHHAPVGGVVLDTARLELEIRVARLRLYDRHESATRDIDHSL
jgi:hypothetical protein